MGSTGILPVSHQAPAIDFPPCETQDAGVPKPPPGSLGRSVVRSFCGTLVMVLRWVVEENWCIHLMPPHVGLFVARFTASKNPAPRPTAWTQSPRTVHQVIRAQPDRMGCRASTQQRNGPIVSQLRSYPTGEPRFEPKNRPPRHAWAGLLKRFGSQSALCHQLADHSMGLMPMCALTPIPARVEP